MNSLGATSLRRPSLALDASDDDVCDDGAKRNYNEPVGALHVLRLTDENTNVVHEVRFCVFYRVPLHCWQHLCRVVTSFFFAREFRGARSRS